MHADMLIWRAPTQAGQLTLAFKRGVATLDGGSTGFFVDADWAEFWHRTGWRMMQSGAIRSRQKWPSYTTEKGAPLFCLAVRICYPSITR